MSLPRSHPSSPIFKNSAILKQVLAQHGDKQIWTSPDSARITQSSPRHALSPQPRLFALLIAINNYKSPNLHDLRDAESDVLSCREYLTTHLNVPQEQTTLLLNEKATRSAIIDAFTKLANDSRIKKGDAIVIYYAGHGGEITPYPGWEAGGPGSKIQMLVPYDYCSVPGHEVPGIPDHTIGALINHIAMTKGDNIIVILDYCNSAFGTRGHIHSDDILFRSVELEVGVYNPEFDRKIIYIGTRDGDKQMNEQVNVDMFSNAENFSITDTAINTAGRDLTIIHNHNTYHDSELFAQLMSNMFAVSSANFQLMMAHSELNNLTLAISSANILRTMVTTDAQRQLVDQHLTDLSQRAQTARSLLQTLSQEATALRANLLPTVPPASEVVSNPDDTSQATSSEPQPAASAAAQSGAEDDADANEVNP